MLHVATISVLDAVIRFDERIRGELIAKIYKLSLPSFAQAEYEFRYQIRIERSILTHANAWKGELRVRLTKRPFPFSSPGDVAQLPVSIRECRA